MVGRVYVLAIPASIRELLSAKLFNIARAWVFIRGKVVHRHDAALARLCGKVGQLWEARILVRQANEAKTDVLLRSIK
jgi:hypothetical protein